LMMKTLSFPFIDFNSPFLATFQFNHVAAHATFLDFNAPIQINTARLHLSHRITWRQKLCCCSSIEILLSNWKSPTRGIDDCKIIIMSEYLPFVFLKTALSTSVHHVSFSLSKMSSTASHQSTQRVTTGMDPEPIKQLKKLPAGEYVGNIHFPPNFLTHCNVAPLILSPSLTPLFLTPPLCSRNL
jgi:hypothetical protein